MAIEREVFLHLFGFVDDCNFSFKPFFISD